MAVEMELLSGEEGAWQAAEASIPMASVGAPSMARPSLPRSTVRSQETDRASCRPSSQGLMSRRIERGVLAFLSAN